MPEAVMKFYHKQYVFRDNKLYHYKLVSFRDTKEPEYTLVYDPAVDPIERLYRTMEEIFLAGHGEFKDKVKSLFC